LVKHLIDLRAAFARLLTGWHLAATMLLLCAPSTGARAAELAFNQAYQGSLSGQTFTTTTALNADPGSIRFADGGSQRAFQNTSGTLYYTVGGVPQSETGVFNSRYPNGNTMMNAVAFSGTGGDRLLVLGGSYTGSNSYSGSSNAIVTKLNEYIDATAPDPAQTTLQVNGGSSATVAVGQTATIVVTVKLSSGAAVSGSTVSLSASPSSGSTISPGSAATNSSGQASFTVQGTSAGTITYQAVASANGTTTTSSSSVSVTYTGVRSAAQSTASVPSGTAGVATTVTITVKDSGGNSVTGAAAGLIATISGTNASVAPSAISEQGNGLYTFTYTPTAAGTDGIAITLDGTAIAGSPYTSVVAAAPSLVFTPVAGALPAGTVATAYSETVSVSGGTAPYTYTATGLPAGVTIGSSTGLVSGTPTAAGNYTVNVTATDSHSATNSVAYTIAVAGLAPVAGTQSLTVAANSSANAATLNISGGAATSVAVSTQATHGTASASGTSITYTPTSGYSGSDSFAYTATNTTGTSAPATISVTVSAPTLVLSPAPGGLPGGTVGTAYSQTITASAGAAPYSFAATGLPAGVTLNPSTGALSGTPTVAGSYSINVSATDAHGATGSAAYTLAIAVQPPVANAASVTVAANSTNNAVTLAITGGAATTVAIGTSASHGVATASGTSISYSPTAGYSGSDSFTYTATNASGTSAPATVTVTVTAVPFTFGPVAGPLPDGSVGTPYTQTISVTGGNAPYSFSATGLPPGLIINPSTGIVSGTPTTAGAYTVNLSVTDVHGAPSTATYTIAIAVQTPVAGPATVTIAANSSSNAVTLNLSGGAASAVTVTTQAAHGTASASGTAITYTPAAGYSGSDSFGYAATNASGTSAPATVSVTVTAPLLGFGPSSGGLPGGAVGTAYSQTVTISGGTAPYSFGATGLPAGLAINSSTGAITGRPAAAGSFQVTIAATDAHGAAGSATYTLAVSDIPPPVAADSTSASVPANTKTEAGQNVGINLSSLVTGTFSEIRIVTPPSHGTVTISRTLASRGGSPLLMMAALASSAALPSQVIAVYTPNANYVGPDSFQFAAIGPGGSSPPATVAIQVIGRAPVARAQTATTIDGQPVSVELTAGAAEGPFTGATIVGITPADQASASIVAGGSDAAGTFRLTVTPKAHFGGAIVISYTLTNPFGTSAPATVTISVSRRPDPSADPVVGAISEAQAEAARRFSRAQVDNFMRRAESLHGDCAGSSNTVRLSARDGTGSPVPDANLDNIDDVRRTGTQDRPADRQAAAAQPARAGKCSGALAIWSAGTIEIGTRDAVTGRSKINANTAGLSGGIDMRLNKRVAVGIGGGFGRDGSSIDDGLGHVSANNKTVTFYGSVAPGTGMFVDAMVARGWLSFDTRRSDATTNLLTKGKRDGRFTTSAVSAGVDRMANSLRWSLYGRVEYLSGTLDAYREHGAGIYDLRFDRRDIRSTTGVLGFRAGYGRPVSFGAISATIRGEWRHEFSGGTGQGLDYADVSSASFYNLQTQGWSREQFVISPGLVLSLPAEWEVGINLGARAAAGERAATSSVQVRKKF
jgi:uncharacterized protein YhjY with autotransporter beta-barrel domain